MTDEEKYIMLVGAVSGAWMAYQSGAPAERSLETIWEFYQDKILNASHEDKHK